MKIGPRSQYNYDITINMTPSSISTTVLETALKICSLAGGDLEVFVLVRPSDGSGGALWAGDERLCDEYRRQRLFPGAADVEVTLDPGTSSLVRKECKADGTLICQPFVPLGAHAQKTCRKRGGSNTTQLFTKKAKVSRQSQAHDLNYDFEQTSNKSTSTSGDVILPSHRSNNNSGGSHAAHQSFLSDGSPTSNGGNSFTTVDPQFVSGQAFASGSAGEGDNSSFNGETVEDPGVQWIYDEFIPRNPKTRDVTTIHDSSVTIKNSYAFKLLNTVLYAFGREAYAKCPYKCGQLKDDACRLYFSQCFDAFFSHFPNLVELDRQKVGFHKTRLKKPYLLSLKSYCRSVVQMSFCKSFTSGGVPSGARLLAIGGGAEGL